MKKTIIALAFFAAPVAFGGSTQTTTQHESTNSNDRFDNRDTRTNSLSTPAHVGASGRTLGADVTEEEYSSSTAETAQPADGWTDSNMSGSSTDNESWEDSEESRMSGTSTGTGTATTGTASPTMGGAATTGDATGTAAGTAASDTSKSKTKKTTKKTTKTSTTETTGTGTTGTTKESVDMNDSRTGASSDQDNRNDRLSGGTTAGSSAGGLTAQDTARNANETELVRKIRSQITDNKDLSMRAHNVKIINQNGQIYLKGPVANASEQSKIEAIAKKMAGNTAVINETYVENR